jgi:hypothetical protein
MRLQYSCPRPLQPTCLRHRPSPTRKYGRAPAIKVKIAAWLRKETQTFKSQEESPEEAGGSCSAAELGSRHDAQAIPPLPVDLMRGLLVRLAEGNSASVPNNAVNIKWLYEQLKASAAVGMRARPSNAAAEPQRRLTWRASTTGRRRKMRETIGDKDLERTVTDSRSTVVTKDGAVGAAAGSRGIPVAIDGLRRKSYRLKRPRCDIHKEARRTIFRPRLLSSAFGRCMLFGRGRGCTAENLTGRRYGQAARGGVTAELFAGCITDRSLQQRQ